MQSYLLGVVLSALLASVSGQMYNCNGVQTIDPPANINNSYVYPATWNTNENPPQYAGGQNCTWKINVPKGMFAYFAIKANTSKVAVLQMTDSTGYVTNFDVAFLEPYYLMDPSFTVSLVATGVGNMGMYVKWYNYKQVTTSVVQVTANGSPMALSIGDFDAGTTITSDTKVSLLSIPPSAQLTDLTPYMRITQVFDGPSINSTLLGNLYQFMSSGKNLVSSGRTLTLYSLYPGYNVGNVAVVQDYFDVSQFKSYKAQWCILPNNCRLSLDATQGTAAALRFSPSPFYVKEMSLLLANKLSVYTDFVTDAHLFAAYTQSNTKTTLPQKFRSTFTTFVLDQGRATADFSSNSVDARWGIPFEFRRGFFASPHFPLYSVMQNFTEQIAGGNTFNITYNVRKADLNDKTQLQVTILDGSKTAVDVVYTAANFPKGPVSARGNNLLVKFISNGTITTGTFIDFEFEKASSSYLNFLVAVIVTLWATLSL